MFTTVMTSDAMTSPFTNFIAPSIDAVELALARERPAPPARLVAVDGADAQLGVDRHLLAGHRVEHEARADLRDALAALRDDDELDDRQDEEDDAADDVVAAHDEVAERLDDLAGVGLEQDKSRRRDVEREAEERREKENGGERRDRERVRHVENDEQDRDGHRQVRRDEDVEQPRRKRHDHHRDDRDDENRESYVGETKARAAREDNGGCFGHIARLVNAHAAVHRQGPRFRREDGALLFVAGDDLPRCERVRGYRFQRRTSGRSCNTALHTPSLMTDIRTRFRSRRACTRNRPRSR